MPSTPYAINTLSMRRTVRAPRQRAIQYPESLAAQLQRDFDLDELHRRYTFTEDDTGCCPLYVFHPADIGTAINPTGHRFVLLLSTEDYFDPLTPEDFALAQELAERCRSVVCLPALPRFPDSSAKEILEAASSVFDYALTKQPDSNRIRLCGVAMGANLALLLCLSLRQAQRPLPGRCALLAPPLRLPPTLQQQEQMAKLDRFSARPSAQYIQQYADMLSKLSVSLADCPHFLTPLSASWEGFPPLYIYYPPRDLYSVYVNECEEACRRGGVTYLVLRENPGENSQSAIAEFLRDTAPVSQATPAPVPDPTRDSHAAALAVGAGLYAAASLTPWVRSSKALTMLLSGAAAMGALAAISDPLQRYMHQKEDTVWDLYAPAYNLFMRQNREAYGRMYELIRDQVRDKRVLELCAGTGLISLHIADITQETIATDFSDNMLHEAQKAQQRDNISHLHFRHADATALPFEDASFDVVILANALHILPQPDLALREVQRVLRRGGIFIAPNFVHGEGQLLSKATAKLLTAAGIAFSVRYTAESYTDFLTRHGFTITNRALLPATIPLLYTVCKRG